jgi:hypothetical protein
LSRQSSTSTSRKGAPVALRQLPFGLARIAALGKAIQVKCDIILQRKGFYGWRVGVLFGCCMSALVLCCNIGLIVAGATSRAGYNSHGIADLLAGDQAVIARWNSAFHVLINTLSTLLLAGSNYTMQVLSSPTRLDIDQIHAKGQWLDIGILSPRNLWTIPRKRAVLWLILGLSSIPLHLLYVSSTKPIIASTYLEKLQRIGVQDRYL